MKNLIKSLVTIISVFAIVFCNASSVYATSVEARNVSLETNNVLSTTGNTSRVSNVVYTNINTSWKTVISAPNGFNHNIYVKCNNTGLIGWTVSPTDIRMLDKNGNILWQESGAIPGQGSRIFLCWNDCYSIQLKTQKGVGAVTVYETDEVPE